MLINTKLKVPSLRSRLLFRRELVNRLNGAQQYPLILFSGPAGCGKTSLVCQWIKAEGLRVAWYSMDQEDNDPDLFFRYLLTSFTLADKKLNDAFGPMLSNQLRLGGKIVIPHLIESLSRLDRTIHLILDDFHYIENEKLLEDFARLIQYIPSCLKLVIISRHALPTSVEIVALKKERMEIAGPDLKFSERETADLFNKIITGGLSSNKIQELNRHVEGWAAGLQLIGLSLRSNVKDSELKNILNQAHEKVAGYLIHDILHMQSEKTRNFIFATALLDRFNPELCVEVTGQKETVRILARLERMNIFLIPLDVQGKWYRYHHMFSEVVRRQTAINDPDLIPTILCKAAKWFAASGHLEDAMRSAFRSLDFEFVADLIEDNIHKYLEAYDPVAGLRWISRLPVDILNQRGLLKLHQCNFLVILMELSKAKEVLASVEGSGRRYLDRYSGKKRILCKDYTIYLNCLMQIMQTKQATTVLELQALSKKISPQNSHLSTAIEMTVVPALISKGHFAPAEASLVRAGKLLAHVDLIIKRVFLTKSKAFMVRLQGRLHQAEVMIHQVQQDLNHQGYGATPMAYLLHRHLGHIYYLQNRLVEARQCAELAVRYCENSGLVDEILAGDELVLQLHLAARNIDSAGECIKRMRAYAVKLGIPRISACADACYARIAIEQGNLGPAVLWSQRRRLQPDEPFSLLFAMECLTQARLYHAQGKDADADHWLEYVRNRCCKRNLAEFVLQIDIVHCAVFHGLKNYETAKSLLSEALAFSETEGYVRPFVNDAKLIAPVLQNIAKDLPPESFTSHLEDVYSSCNISFLQADLQDEDENGRYEDLTQREVEILEWIARGAQNKEIAQKAFISINTVKTHVRSILAKLGVRTRTQAIIKAKEMEILTNE